MVFLGGWILLLSLHAYERGRDFRPSMALKSRLSAGTCCCAHAVAELYLRPFQKGSKTMALLEKELRRRRGDVFRGGEQSRRGGAKSADECLRQRSLYEVEGFKQAAAGARVAAAHLGGLLQHLSS